jgi:molybdopterin-containing oxidoreductase family membrane subunit
MWFLLFIKQLPIVAIAEVKEIVPPKLRVAHPHADHIDTASRHLEYEPDTPGEYD